MVEYKRHYQPTISKPHTGSDTTHLIYHFENGYGASVIPEYNPSSYTTLVPVPGKLELAVVYWDANNDFHILDWEHLVMNQLGNYSDNPVRYLTQAEVDELLDKIAGL